MTEKQREIKLRAARIQASRMSRETGIAYIHEFEDRFQVSIAKGSGKKVKYTYKNGNEIAN